jgi:hypothetical protein
MKTQKWGGSKAEKAWGTFNRIQAPKQAPGYKKAFSRADREWDIHFNRIAAPKRAPSHKKGWSKANKEVERDRVIGMKRAPGAKSNKRKA